MINYARDHTTQDGLDYVAIWNASHFQKEEMTLFLKKFIIGEGMPSNKKGAEAPFLIYFLLQLSRSVTVRLNTNLSSVDSLSTIK